MGGAVVVDVWLGTATALFLSQTPSFLHSVVFRFVPLLMQKGYLHRVLSTNACVCMEHATGASCGFSRVRGLLSAVSADLTTE